MVKYKSTQFVQFGLVQLSSVQRSATQLSTFPFTSVQPSSVQPSRLPFSPAKSTSVQSSAAKGTLLHGGSAHSALIQHSSTQLSRVQPKVASQFSSTVSHFTSLRQAEFTAFNSLKRRTFQEKEGPAPVYSRSI